MIETLKKIPLFRWAMKIPGVAGAYHYFLARRAAGKYGNPSKKIFTIGITGTKGKTTTIELLNAILEAAHKKTAICSSLRIKIGDEIEKNSSNNTMLGRSFIQKFLSRAVAAGCGYALVEVTSQGVVQSRHRFIDWKIGAITNLSPEHIEAHGSFEKYRAAKLSFLRYAAAEGAAVFLNKNDGAFGFFKENLKGAVARASDKNDEEFRRMLPSENPMWPASKRLQYELFTSDFNLGNIALAVAIARQIGIDTETIRSALGQFRGVPGRMNIVIESPFLAVVDYAHTPDSLRAAYGALRESRFMGHDSKLIAVLGAAGGGRDKWKRPEMGKIAAEYCQKIVLTNEDPYDEDPDQIIREVQAGVLEAHFPIESLFVIPDRAEAIAMALSLAEPGDAVIMTGKGSESWIRGPKGERIPWDERNAVLGAFQKIRKEI